jgi:hypothetical protein
MVVGQIDSRILLPLGCLMTGGFAPFVLTYLKMQSRRHVVTTCFVNNV